VERNQWVKREGQFNEDWQGGRISIRRGMNSRDDEHVMVWDRVVECGSAAHLKKKIPISTFFQRH
jgi:hypothetical protein